MASRPLSVIEIQSSPVLVATNSANFLNSGKHSSRSRRVTTHICQGARSHPGSTAQMRPLSNSSMTWANERSTVRPSSRSRRVTTHICQGARSHPGSTAQMRPLSNSSMTWANERSTVRPRCPSKSSLSAIWSCGQRTYAKVHVPIQGAPHKCDRFLIHQ